MSTGYCTVASCVSRVGDSAFRRGEKLMETRLNRAMRNAAKYLCADDYNTFVFVIGSLREKLVRIENGPAAAERSRKWITRHSDLWLTARVRRSNCSAEGRRDGRR